MGRKAVFNKNVMITTSFDGIRFCTHEKFALTQKAQMALSLVERWGMVACETDGEDSAGRTRLKIMKPTDLVTRALSITEVLFLEMERLSGYLIEMPSLEDAEKFCEEK